MVANRPLAQAQGGGNLPVGDTAAQQLENFLLALGQLLDTRGNARARGCPCGLGERGKHPEHFHYTRWQVVDTDHLVQDWYIVGGKKPVSQAHLEFTRRPATAAGGVSAP